jgi:hypothetical protein
VSPRPDWEEMTFMGRYYWHHTTGTIHSHASAHTPFKSCCLPVTLVRVPIFILLWASLTPGALQASRYSECSTYRHPGIVSAVHTGIQV